MAPEARSVSFELSEVVFEPVRYGKGDGLSFRFDERGSGSFPAVPMFTPSVTSPAGDRAELAGEGGDEKELFAIS
jgi:hypothetical protein